MAATDANIKSETLLTCNINSCNNISTFVVKRQQSVRFLAGPMCHINTLTYHYVHWIGPMGGFAISDKRSFKNMTKIIFVLYETEFEDI